MGPAQQADLQHDPLDQREVATSDASSAPDSPAKWPIFAAGMSFEPRGGAEPIPSSPAR